MIEAAMCPYRLPAAKDSLGKEPTRAYQNTDSE